MRMRSPMGRRNTGQHRRNILGIDACCHNGSYSVVTMNHIAKWILVLLFLHSDDYMTGQSRNEH